MKNYPSSIRCLDSNSQPPRLNTRSGFPPNFTTYKINPQECQRPFAFLPNLVTLIRFNKCNPTFGQYFWVQKIVEKYFDLAKNFENILSLESRHSLRTIFRKKHFTAKNDLLWDQCDQKRERE